MLPTVDCSDSQEEEDYSEQNARATYAKAKSAHIQPIIQQQPVQVEIEPRSIRTRAGQVITRTHQRLINLAINSLQDDEDSGPPNLESDDDDKENVNVIPKFEVQDDGVIEFMHNINIMAFPDKVIRINKQTGQIVSSSLPYHNWSRGLYQTIALRTLLICTRQMTFGYRTGKARKLMLADE
jgi:hypothetical protein